MAHFQNTISPSWKGFDEIKFLFILYVTFANGSTLCIRIKFVHNSGDSYSTVGAPQEPMPTKDKPLGISFPGHTYNDYDKPNWVGYLVKKYPSLLAYDYAVGGSQVDDVRGQIQTRFLPSAGQKPGWASWDGSNSLFVTWIGINDCEFRSSWNKSRFEMYQQQLLEQEESLYLAGARNFLFIDIPPLEKSPAYRGGYSRHHEQQTVFDNWNSALYHSVAKFAAAHPDTTTLLYSSHDVFSRMLANPSAYGLNASNAHRSGGSIWFDYLHPTSAVHSILAREIDEFLAAQAPIANPSMTSTVELAAEPDRSWDSIRINVGLDWPGLTGLKHIIIFGASYCDVGYNRKSPHPTLEEPLGVPFPGMTWAEPGKANWVGHLVNRLKSKGTKVLVYDFALGGDTVDGVKRQIHREFLAELASQPEWAPWTSSDTLFIVFVGINDCAMMDIDRVPSRVDELFTHLRTVYNAGAQNFLLVNMPPMERSPTGVRIERSHGTFEKWNDVLQTSAKQFASDHPGVTMLIYSSHATFTRVLNDPAAYGFRKEDLRKAGGSIWADQSHPSSKMHDEMAKDMISFMSCITRSSRGAV
ncbi:hypothetical protein NM688_g1712 [Phlebia brevispora]|uniref:Uncharacterized protein n=1 Tax=Phlebia brevispora TaxID=194682 RepID=A0ACC1TAK3_9APHY|nr:hypothetical protein NM688_g1712 [Phlebia brevispora]